MLQPLKHVKLVVDHALVALDILLQNDLDSHLARGAIGLPHDAVCACTQSPAEPVLGSLRRIVRIFIRVRGLA